MKNFVYVIKDELGLHARPAAMLVQEANKFESKITIECNGKEAEVSKLFSLMTLNVRCGSSVTITIDGSDEGAAYTAIKKFFEENL
jgi:phosphocarrier protein